MTTSKKAKSLLCSEPRFSTHLVFWSVPVVDYAGRDQEAVVHVAAAAVIPPAIVAHLGFPVGKAYGSLASCSGQKKRLWLLHFSNTVERSHTILKWNKSQQQERNCREYIYRHVPFFRLQCRRCGLDPWVRKIPWRKRPLTPVFLPGKSHGQRSLVGCSPGVAKSRTWLTEHARLLPSQAASPLWPPGGLLTLVHFWSLLIPLLCTAARDHLSTTNAPSSPLFLLRNPTSTRHLAEGFSYRILFNPCNNSVRKILSSFLQMNKLRFIYPGEVFCLEVTQPARASLVTQMVKNLPAIWETWVHSLGWEDPLKKGMATHSSALAWKIPWTEEPGKLQFTGSQRVGHDWATKPSIPSQRWRLGWVLNLSDSKMILKPDM